MRANHNRIPRICQEFSLLLQAAPPSAGGCAAASGRRSGPSVPLPHGSLRDPLALRTDETDSLWPSMMVDPPSDSNPSRAQESGVRSMLSAGAVLQGAHPTRCQ